MDEPTISGPAAVIGWNDRFDGPTLEVPLSIPPDKVWMSAHQMYVDDKGFAVSHGITIVVEESKIILRSASSNPRTALDWLEGHLSRVSEKARDLRQRWQAAETEAKAWWTERVRRRLVE